MKKDFFKAGDFSKNSASSMTGIRVKVKFQLCHRHIFYKQGLRGRRQIIFG